MLRWIVTSLYLLIAILWLFLRTTVADAHELYDKIVPDHIDAVSNAALIGVAFSVALALAAACRRLHHARTLQATIMIGVLAVAYLIASLLLVITQGNLRLTA